ncbi:MAG: 23S rRNA (uracil(1939)-C(5))-methyltransferase RlmD [Candidatus Binatia bacterium]
MPETNENSTRSDPIIPLTIGSLSYGPYGVGRDGRRVILVPQTAPGDEAEVRIVTEKKNYATGELLRLVKPSPHRQTPPCRYVPACGGCPWQHVSYHHQLAAKEAIVRESLRRIGGFLEFPLLPIVSSPSEYHYRRRIRLQCDSSKRLGFHRASSHELIEIDDCLIADPELNPRLALAREWAALLMTPLQHIEMVRGDQAGEVVFAGYSAGDFASGDDRACSLFLARHPELFGLVLRGRNWRHTWGDPKVVITTEYQIPLSVDADVFSQVNAIGGSGLVRELLRWGDFHKPDRVLELYCGAGNFTLPIAARAGKVCAVEQNRWAVENARQNSRLNRLQNIEWVCADAAQAVTRLNRRKENFAAIILNPPRSGAKGLERMLPNLRAEKIFYVSCNPSTLARDLAALKKTGYSLVQIRPFDLFPHTFHVETLAEMRR